MTTTKKSPHSQWIEDKFIEWRRNQTTRRATIDQFVEFVGISRSDYNNYTLRGTKPRGADLERIGETLGHEIYDLLGLERPDPQLRRVKELFNSLPPELRDKAEELLRKLAGDPLLGKPEKAEKLRATKGKAG